MAVPLTLSQVPAATPYVQYVASGGQTLFPYSFPITQDSDLVVVINGVTQATDSGYTLSGQGNPTGGNLTFTIGRTSGDIVTLFRNIAIQRITQIGQNSGFSSTAFNAEYNNLYLIAQQLQAALAQCLQLPNTNNPAPVTSLTPGAYANKYLSFDANGNPTPALLTSSGALTAAILGGLLNPTLAAETSAGAVVTAPQYAAVNVLRYGADSTGVADSTTVIQKAADTVRFLGGGVLYFPAGTYKINRSITLGSGTTVRGDGPKATTIQANSIYVGVGGTSYATETSPLFQNQNFAASVLTDTDIAFENIGFNWGAVTIAGGGAHSIGLRFVDRVRINNVFSQGGENVTALLNCRDTKTYFSEGLNCSNAYFDHWDGTAGAEVIACTGRTLTGTTAQGIQFTGQGSFGDSAAGQNCVVAFCQLYGIHNASNQASAIIANANGAASSIARMLSFGNYVEASDNGIVFQGATGRGKSVGDYFKSVTGQPIFFNPDASGSPGNCVVLNPTLEDCNHTSGSALVSISGQNNRVEDIFAFSPSGVLYTLVATFPQAASTCYAHIASAPNGITGFRWSNSGGGSNIVKDTGDFDAQPATGFPTIASAATIAPTAPISFVSGTTQITTITPPPGIKYAGGEIVLNPTGLWTTGTTGNISLGSTAVVNRPLRMTYQPNTGTWLPSY